MRSATVGQVFALGLLFSSPACRLDVAIDPTNLGCDDGQCPNGFSCVDFVCVPDAPPPANAGTCNQATLVADDFERGRREAVWGRAYSAEGATTSIAEGRLRITLAADTAPAYAGYATDHYYDLTGTAVETEIAQMVDTSSHAVMQLQILRVGDGASANSEVAGIRQEHGSLHLFTRVRGRDSDESVPYDGDEQRFWRLREQAGFLYFETSGGGGEWDVARKIAAPFDLTLVRIEVSAGVYQTESSPGVAEFEAVNAGARRGTPCKAATLVDDFEDGERDQRWANSYDAPHCETIEADGAFIGRGPDSADFEQYCAYASAAAYDLTGSQLVVEIARMIDTRDDSPGVAFVKLTSDEDDHGVELLVTAGKLTCRVWHDGEVSVVDSSDWDAGEDRFWRLAEVDGTVFWSTSPDGRDWTDRCGVPTDTVDVDDVAVSLGVGVFYPAPGTSIGSFEVAGVNVVF